MFKLKANNKKGVVLYMVLGMLLVVVVLANVVLSIILSHGRLTQHQVGRIQAYYAAQAGMNLAMENLRIGAWTTGAYALCPSAGAGCTLVDNNIPYRVDINIGAPGTSIDGVGRQITFTATYTTPQ